VLVVSRVAGVFRVAGACGVVAIMFGLALLVAVGELVRVVDGRHVE
jgi:hypothetical protein